MRVAELRYLLLVGLLTTSSATAAQDVFVPITVLVKTEEANRYGMYA